MKKFTLNIASLLFCLQLFAQPGVRRLKIFQKAYVDSHEVVKGDDKKYFQFFPVDLDYTVSATLEKISDTTGFIMKTSGSKAPKFFKYGKLNFFIHDTLYHLTVYQGE